MPPTYPPDQHIRNIYSMFSYIDQDVICSIINHTLRGSDIYQLDARRVLDRQWDFVNSALEDSVVSPAVTPSAGDLYKTIDALLVPLNVYFSVLCMHGLASGQSAILPVHFFRYSSHILKLETQYEWPAVISYHFAFFARRCKEMRTGDYTGWGKMEVDLMEKLLVAHRKENKSRSRHL